MSVDLLQERIRKLKCPLIVDFSVNPDCMPAHIRENRTEAEAYALFCRELLDGLKGVVPAVRFSFDHIALMGGLELLPAMLRYAGELGFYVMLDAPSVNTPWAAERAASLLSAQTQYPCHCLIADPYLGSDAIRPFLPYCKEGRSVFFAVRSANKSAAELQDLMTGSRLVHLAAADMVNRHGEALYGKSGYSNVGILTAATNANAVTGIRTKYKRMFLLVDGVDYPGGNSKICSYGFDKFGHGCAVSAGPSVVGAWREDGGDGTLFVQQAVKAAERLRGNIGRYVTIL